MGVKKEKNEISRGVEGEEWKGSVGAGRRGVSAERTGVLGRDPTRGVPVQSR